jgi:MoaA/NifB/PqqE/SkfB family radical SAM enzyme
MERILRGIRDRLAPVELDWIQVELSARCSGGCTYCPVSLWADRRRDGFMGAETFSRLLPSFPLAELVFLQGWGEPLLHPRFWEMARQTVASGVRVGFTTGGALLDRENRRALLESGVEILGVSLAGATPATHDRFRPGNPLQVLDANLRALSREKEAVGQEHPRLHLAFLLLIDNLEELPGVLDLAVGWGAAQVVASHLSLVLTPELEEQSLLPRPQEWSRASDILGESRARARGIGFHAYGVGAPEGEPSCKENVLKSCFVSAEGEVSPCVMCNLGLTDGAVATHRLRGENVPIRTLTFGNVREKALEEIWRCEAARAFRRTFRDRVWRGTRGRDGLPNPCRDCLKLLEC